MNLGGQTYTKKLTYLSFFLDKMSKQLQMKGCCFSKSMSQNCNKNFATYFILLNIVKLSWCTRLHL
jgi:hypothetical protein